MFLFASFLLAPFDARSMNYSLELFSEFIWGIIFLTIGIAMAYGIYKRNHKWYARAALASTLIFFMWTVMLFIGAHTAMPLVNNAALLLVHGWSRVLAKQDQLFLPGRVRL